MEIRFAQTKDIPDMIELLYQVGGVHHDIRPDIFRPSAIKYTEKDLESILSDPEKPIFVAAQNGRVLGYCFCQLRNYAGSTVLTDRKELYIDDLCVDEHCRNMHIGRTLYHHTCAWAKSIGCQFVTLNVWCGNENAMKFYQNRGMQERSITMEQKL